VQHNSVKYTIVFSIITCLFCSILVATAAVVLSDKQKYNEILDRQRNVLESCGIIKPRESISAQEINERFKQIRIKIVELKTGDYSQNINPETYNQLKASKDPALSIAAPVNNAGIMRIPKYGIVYQVIQKDSVEMLIFPIEGLGLWGTLYGYIAVDVKDFSTIRGITYYSHKETPGLGGEVDNPRWKSLWPKRRIFNENGQLKISVIKGQAGSPDQDPYQVDGLSGATITGRGVSNMLAFWFGKNGFEPYLNKIKSQGGI